MPVTQVETTQPLSIQMLSSGVLSYSVYAMHLAIGAMLPPVNEQAKKLFLD
jgi:hypothetical protein